MIIRRPLAIAALFAAAGAAVLTAAPARAEASTFPITDGTLDWGVKESFRKYVTGPIGHGEISASGGATVNADGTFRFPGGEGAYDPATHDVTTAFDGSVTFRAHKTGDDWKLETTVSQVRLTTTGKTGKLTVDVSSKDMSTGKTVVYDDVDFAALDLSGVRPGQSGGYTTLANIPATLTAAGAPAFGGFYQAGAALDPASAALKASATTPTTPPSSSPPAASGTIKAGNLDWGVKESFRKYITGPIASGGTEVTGGAASTAGGFRFPGATGDFDQAKQTLTAKLGGAVRFYGHKKADGTWELDTTFKDLSLKVSGGKGTLYTGTTPLAELGKVPTMTPKDGVLTLSAVAATLTPEGKAVFGGFYEPGTALDPVTLAVSLKDDATLPGTEPGENTPTGTRAPSVSLAKTGASLPLLGLSGGVLLAGGTTALLVVRRKRVRA
ncbi:hypothetical protein Afil01_64560 [Actinorhabdospora filicis]|uniref:Htaa domain-containing protein n=1 Tax=Actinorhabdospora filicis TaxID=1785913 RepID=A0A9W6WCH5_9ACTN|nr:HtaA domain-containing protein [Actinorhabdospora filicis]GLZ81649.1 hypothetical protein Afil01_64560 [Actinorhabdospora filicis]